MRLCFWRALLYYLVTTMGGISRFWQTALAICFSAILVIGAYILARGSVGTLVAEASAESAILAQIAQQDSDGDGLPDWEESLYGTDPRITDSRHLGMTDGQAVAKGLIVPKAVANLSTGTSSPASMLPTDLGLPPAPAQDTLTAAFAQDFFETYLQVRQQKNGNLTEADLQAIVQQVLTDLSKSVRPAPSFKTQSDLTISNDSSPAALTAFAVAAEAVLKNNKVNASESEVVYLKDAAEHHTTEPLTHMNSIASVYRKSAAGLAALPVPAALASDDLLLINAFARLSAIITDFGKINTDPLATMLALGQYPQAAVDLGTAFLHIGQIYASAGITLPAGAPGASFVNLLSDVAAEQKAGTLPNP